MSSEIVIQHINLPNTMERTQCPALPAELWLRVLENLQKEEDLPELWTSHRYVCTAFKQAVEAIMRENHLRKTWINFQLGTYFPLWL